MLLGLENDGCTKSRYVLGICLSNNVFYAARICESPSDVHILLHDITCFTVVLNGYPFVFIGIENDLVALDNIDRLTAEKLLDKIIFTVLFGGAADVENRCIDSSTDRCYLFCFCLGADTCVEVLLGNVTLNVSGTDLNKTVLGVRFKEADTVSGKITDYIGIRRCCGTNIEK